MERRVAKENEAMDGFSGAEQFTVKETARISAQDISGVANGPLLALRVPNFVPLRSCAHAIHNLEGFSDWQSYAVAPDIQKIGDAIFDAADNPAALDDYYRNAPAAYERARDAFDPYACPMDVLRARLQEIWPAGATLESLHGRLMFVGLIRSFGEGAEARPHQDNANWDVPYSKPAQTLKTQLACNIYMSEADAGGALELWDFGIEDHKTYRATQVAGDYGLNREIVGMPNVVIQPRVGELIIFNARRVHAVTRIAKGRRTAISGFIGYRSDVDPLTMFS